MASAAIFSGGFSLFIMAAALGMDGFSLGMGMGMLGLRLKQIFKIGITIGIFHVFMPLFGMLIGEYLSAHFGQIAAMAGGLLLVFLGFQMCYSSFASKEGPAVKPIGFGLIIFSLSVSLDSFSVGLSLGIYGAKILMTILLFGLMSMGMTWAGMLIGRKFEKLLGKYSEMLGGGILLLFGLKLLFKF